MHFVCVRAKGGIDGHSRGRNSNRSNDPTSGRSVRDAQQISADFQRRQRRACRYNLVQLETTQAAGFAFVLAQSIMYFV